MADTTWLKLTGQVPMFGSSADLHGMGMSYIGGTYAPQCCACNGTCSHTGPHTWCERHAPPLSYQANTAGPARSAQRCPVCFGSGRYRPASQGGAEGPCHGCGTLGWVVV